MKFEAFVALLQHSVAAHTCTYKHKHARGEAGRVREKARSIASLARSRVAPLSHVRHYVKKKKEKKAQKAEVLNGRRGGGARYRRLKLVQGYSLITSVSIRRLPALGDDIFYRC